jgi:hypothetical protein
MSFWVTLQLFYIIRIWHSKPITTEQAGSKCDDSHFYEGKWLVRISTMTWTVGTQDMRGLRQFLNTSNGLDT